MSLITFLFILFLFTSLLLCLIVKEKIYSPVFIVSLLWFFLIVIYTFFDLGMYPLSDSVLQVFFLWVFSFIIGCLLSYKVKITNRQEYKEYDDGIKDLLYKISIYSIPFIIFKIASIASSGGGDFFYNIRSSAIGLGETEEKVGFLQYVAPIALISFLVEIFHHKEDTSRKRIYWLLIVNILCILMFMSKTGIFYLLIPSLIVFSFKKKIKIKQFLLVVICLFFLFSLLHLSRGDAGGQGILAIVGDMFNVYIFGGLPAMDQLMNENPTSGLFGEHIFPSFYKLLNVLGMDFKFNMGKEFIGENGYASVPFFTNVFTVVQGFYQDFGNIGVSFGGIITGGFTTIIYRLARNKVTWAVIVYSHLAASLSLQFFGDLIFSMLSQTIQIFMWPYLIYNFHLEYKFFIIKPSRYKKLFQ